MASIRIVKLLKKFGELRAVDDLNYTFADGKVTCLLGPSGCGKTTLLRMIGGLETITSGEIYLGDKEVTGIPTSKRNVGMVFQNSVVYRGLSVEEDISLPLKKAKVPSGEIVSRVNDVLTLLDLEDVRKSEAWKLPNVIRQKVAVAREIARRPDILLFDEPLTNVDANAKTAFKRSFKNITQKLRQTIVYVTHDQTEAMTFGDYIALMKDGKIVQYDNPRELYNYPHELFGGWFLGNPGMNFFKPKLTEADGQLLIESPLLMKPLTTGSREGLKDGLSLGIRPEHVIVSNELIDASCVRMSLKQKWIVVGGQYLLTASIGDMMIRIKVTPEMGQKINAQFFCKLPPEHIIVFNSKGERVALN